MTTGRPAPRRLFVSDFDGTVTRHDFFQLVVTELAPPGLGRHWADYRAGRITHFEALRNIFGAIPAGEAAVRELARRAAPDPELAALAAELDRAGWDVVIASAGCAWYIELILAEAGAGHLPVHACPGWFGEGWGLVMEAPAGSPYFTPATGIDKAAVVREGLAAGREVAFAGDGLTDVPAARLVPAGVRFARADLAAALGGEGLAYVPFERWSEAARALLRVS